MRDIVNVKADELFILIQQIFNRTQKVKITVTGKSMSPFLLEGRDSVELKQVSYALLKVNEIALLRKVSDQYVLHRVTRKNSECFYVAGDAQSCIEGPLMPEQLLAVVSAVWRGKKRISCDNPWWRFLSYAWLVLLPFRGFILGFLRKAKHLAGF
jgi:signal peptidase I